MLRFRSSTFLGSSLLATVACLTLVAAKPGDWPQWRGPARDGHSVSSRLLKQWPEQGPQVVWQVDNVGASYSSVSVADGRVFTMGNVDDEGRLICLDEQTGRTLWSIRPPAENRVYTHGRGDGARGTPTVDGDRVYAIGGGGDVTCADAESGNVVWSLHMLDDLEGGRRPPGWGYSESPLIDGDRVIVTPGGPKGTVAALNKLTGDVIWRSTDVTDGAHYSSAILAEVEGVRQIIQFTNSRVVGLDADTGRLLWDYSKSANRTANVATPIYADGHVFSSSAYGTGGGLVKLTRNGDEFTAEEVYFSNPMANHHGGIILVDGYMYGFGSGGLLCMEFKTGDIAWRNRSVGKGSLCYADGHLYCLSENNRLGLVEVNPSEYVEKGRIEIPKSDFPSWAHPVVANGRLYIRDQDQLTCYEVSQTR